MQDRELYRHESPWKVVRVELRRADEASPLAVPPMQRRVRTPDHQPERRLQYRTILHARPPRSDCSEHGPRVVRLPFQPLALAISWLKEASQQGIAELLALSWDEIHGILERAVQRGLRAAEPNEKSFRKRHR